MAGGAPSGLATGWPAAVPGRHHKNHGHGEGMGTKCIQYPDSGTTAVACLSGIRPQTLPLRNGRGGRRASQRSAFMVLPLGIVQLPSRCERFGFPSAHQGLGLDFDSSGHPLRVARALIKIATYAASRRSRWQRPSRQGGWRRLETRATPVLCAPASTREVRRHPPATRCGGRHACVAGGSLKQSRMTTFSRARAGLAPVTA